MIYVYKSQDIVSCKTLHHAASLQQTANFVISILIFREIMLNISCGDFSHEK